MVSINRAVLTVGVMNNNPVVYRLMFSVKSESFSNFEVVVYYSNGEYISSTFVASTVDEAWYFFLPAVLPDGSRPVKMCVYSSCVNVETVYESLDGLQCKPLYLYPNMSYVYMLYTYATLDKTVQVDPKAGCVPYIQDVDGTISVAGSYNNNDVLYYGTVGVTDANPTTVSLSPVSELYAVLLDPLTTWEGVPARYSIYGDVPPEVRPDVENLWSTAPPIAQWQTVVDGSLSQTTPIYKYVDLSGNIAGYLVDRSAAAAASTSVLAKVLRSLGYYVEKGIPIVERAGVAIARYTAKTLRELGKVIASTSASARNFVKQATKYAAIGGVFLVTLTGLNTINNYFEQKKYYEIQETCSVLQQAYQTCLSKSNPESCKDLQAALSRCALTQQSTSTIPVSDIISLVLIAFTINMMSSLMRRRD